MIDAHLVKIEVIKNKKHSENANTSACSGIHCIIYISLEDVNVGDSERAKFLRVTFSHGFSNKLRSPHVPRFNITYGVAMLLVGLDGIM